MEQQEPLPPNFGWLAARVFTDLNGEVRIGGEKVSDEVRDILRDEAKYIARSRLWEIMDATITNEAANMALIKSTSWEHVDTAKMLHHWAFVFRNMLHKLEK